MSELCFVESFSWRWLLC